MQSTLKRLDDYVETGPQFRLATISRCADTLRHLVEQMRQYVVDRAPLGEQVRRTATEIAIQLLSIICARNNDIYDEITWTKTAPDSEAQDDRNLFANLIGGGGFFIIDFLEESSPHDWRHLLHVFDNILEQLRDNEAPAAYVERLEHLVSADDQGQDDPTRTVGERPAVSGERESQRRRIQ